MSRGLYKIAIILGLCASNTIAGYGTPNIDCTPFTYSGPTNSTPYSEGCQSTQSWQLTTLYKTEQRVIKWPDGATSNVTASSTGGCVLVHPNCHFDFTIENICDGNDFNAPANPCYRVAWECWPEFFPPDYNSNGHYEQTLFRKGNPLFTEDCGGLAGHRDLYGEDRCSRGSSDDTNGTKRDHTCPSGGCETIDQDYDGWDQCEDCDDTYYDPYNTCAGPTCDSCSFDADCYECDLTSYCEVGRCWATTPILIDINGDGYHLTPAAGGVTFDMSGYGSRQALSWTAAGSDDAWLVLDRNGNGMIDNGTEFFGSATPQAHTGNSPNGFNALAHYDRPLSGGNGDGVIDRRDAIFASLRLWQDLNHNGISESRELHTLPELGVNTIGLDYKESRRTDQYGNRFRYRAKVYDSHGAHVGRWAWDVSLVPLR
jgi:hypothetical protein